MRIDWSFVKGSAVVGIGNVFVWMEKEQYEATFKLLNARGGYS